MITCLELKHEEEQSPEQERKLSRFCVRGRDVDISMKYAEKQ